MEFIDKLIITKQRALVYQGTKTLSLMIHLLYFNECFEAEKSMITPFSIVKKTYFIFYEF